MDISTVIQDICVAEYITVIERISMEGTSVLLIKRKRLIYVTVNVDNSFMLRITGYSIE